MNEPLWWSSLRHSGLLLSAGRLADLFPDPAESLSTRLADQLRADVLRAADQPANSDAASALLDTVLHQIAGLQDDTDARWQRGNHVDAKYARRSLTGEMVKPRRVWRGPRGAVLPVFVDDEPRLGIGRGRRAVSRVLEWCRGTGHPIALLTNARQFRFCYVAAEHDAWAQWDASLWFEAGVPSFQVEALVHLLGPRVHIPPADDQPSPLLDAIRASRQGQSQLTSLLGERVRQAVELLIHAHAPHLRAQPDIPRADVYRGATLVVMRLVVSLFAEARDLLPRSNRIYEASYSLQGLREKLHRAAGGNTSRLRSRHGSWPQVLALFRLIYSGSPHDELPLRAYGGELFRPGLNDAPETVRRAMHLFETAALAGDPPAMSDADVLTLIELLTRCAVPVRQGRSVTTVTMPVDFADLSTEYIGILYEGLLDYELNQVPATSTDPILFLNVGDEPALPLSRLEALEGAALRDFFKEFQKKKGLSTGGEEEASEDEEEDADTEGTDDLDAAAAATDALAAVEEAAVAEAADPAMEAKQRALAWARRAVVEAKLVRAYTGNDPGRRAEAEERIGRAANQLLARPPVLPGDYFLVRWGGTRKGQGSFYTRPGLVEPTVRRTLAPLCYELPAEPSADELRDPQSPKPPATILALKVADISMGSASFLVSALRYLTDALWRSLLHHRWIVAGPSEGAPYVPGSGLPTGEPPWFRECVRDLPMEHGAAENTIRARLKRLVVERCLYGVDLDPLAVELARLSLWVETMDRDLPFGFLDHKLKCGNSLIGCWFDRLCDFPALCLHRPGEDAGDKSHVTAVHNAKGRLSASQKEFRDSVLKPALVHWIEARDPSVFGFLHDGQTPDNLHAATLRLFEEMHALPLLTEHDVEARAAFYRDRVEPALTPLRAAFDLWCALWFWPAEQLAHFPLPFQEERKPGRNLFTEPSPEALQIVAEIRGRLRFFHWEIEFPDVFTVTGSGFDALLGNPPWEVEKPNSKEFFSNYDPLYRTYGKQHALAQQLELFKIDSAIERDWLEYSARFKALSNWCANAAHPWGDPMDGANDWSLARGRAGAELHSSWRDRRACRSGFTDPAHAFRHQGSADLNTYKLFLEQNHALLRSGGRLGVIVPSNVYTDKGSTDLRRLFLDACRWEWLFGFENREKLFDIDSRFKFCSLIVQKGGQTVATRTAFMRRRLADWSEAEVHALPYLREQVEQFSPKSLAILELRSERDVQILGKMYRHCVLLGDESPQGWGLRYAREFDMSTDSKSFPPRGVWEDNGYMPDEYGHWIKGRWIPITECGLPMADQNGWFHEPWRRARSILVRPEGLILSRDGRSAIRVEAIDDVALPLYQGLMVWHFDFAASYHVGPGSSAAAWRDNEPSSPVIQSQYLVSLASARERLDSTNWFKVHHRRIQNVTNKRTMTATILPGFPAGDTLARLTFVETERDFWFLTVLNSFPADMVTRLKVSQNHVDLHYIIDVPIPDAAAFSVEGAFISARLAAPHPTFSPLWLTLVANSRLAERISRTRSPLQSLWALTENERLRLRCMADAITAAAYGLDYSDLGHLLRGCDSPAESTRSNIFTRTLDSKGFWRVDKEKDPELRHTVLSLVAFQDLQRMGLDAFLAQNDGEGWMLPETLRLADYGLGHDDRAREPQPVASRFGPRFYPWQLEGTVEESWEECRRHAANLRAIRSIGAPAASPLPEGTPAASGPAPIMTDLFGHPIETDLLGQEISNRNRKRR